MRQLKKRCRILPAGYYSHGERCRNLPAGYYRHGEERSDVAIPPVIGGFISPPVFPGSG